MIMNVWLEKKFKGYLYLTKKVRRQMYDDTQIIVKKLEKFCAENIVNIDDLRKLFNKNGWLFPDGGEEKLTYLYQIMMFLEPEKYYHYIETTSFGKLLRNPDKEKLEGDCNQIVTLYIYLYALKFSVSDLRIKLLPEHVCLHFREIDIECTNGQFAKYRENPDTLPVTEIISTNLLDLKDFREDAQRITPQIIIKSAQLAYAISSLKSMVAKNLQIAYRNMAIAALKNHEYESAIFFAEKEGTREFENQIQKASYHEQYNELVRKVADVKTIKEAKNKKYVYQKMLILAEKMENPDIVASVKKTLEKINFISG